MQRSACNVLVMGENMTNTDIRTVSAAAGEQHQAANRKLLKSVAMGCASVLALAVGMEAAHAQGAVDGGASADQTAEAPKSIVQEVQITGSRIQRSGFTTPTPVTVIDRAQMDDLGFVNIGDVVGQLPMNNPEISPTNTSQGSLNAYVSDANVGAQLANLRGLNPFFGTRTLTLVDGHRFVPSTNGGAVDLSLIPSNLVQSIEVVTGGASAAYGSDAVAGVVNVRLNHNLEGIRGQVDYGETFRSDGGDFHVGLAGGTSLFDGKGHFVIGGEFQHSQAIGACSATRSWCQQYAIFDTTTAEQTNLNLPDYYEVNNARAALTDSGAIIATTTFAPPGPPFFTTDYYNVPTTFTFDQIPDAFRGKKFNDAGTELVDWQTGQFIDPATRLMAGGDGPPADFGVLLKEPYERKILYSRFEYDFSDSFQGFLEGSYGKRTAQNSGVGIQNSIVGTTGTIIKCDNAYLQQVTNYDFNDFDVNGDGDCLDAGDISGFYINKSNVDFPTPESTAKNETYRLVAGLNGEFAESWTWDLYYTYGKNKQAQRYLNARRDPRGAADETGFNSGTTPATATQYDISPWIWAVDAVVDPMDNTTIKCRVQVDDATINPDYAAIQANPNIAQIANDCVPLNILGVGNGTQAAYDNVFGTEKEDYSFTQNVIGGNIQGEVFDIWAGPIIAATGFEWRHESSNTTHDGYPPEYWRPDYGSDFSGKLNLIEGYGEVDIPLLKEMPFAEALNFNGAIRQTHSRQSGQGVKKSFDITTWKMSLVWDTTDWLRFRGTRSHDVRAPSFRELFFPGRNTNFFTANPWTMASRDNIVIIGNGGGNVDLVPENADTWTLGVVLQPGGAFDGLRFSADWYQIKLDNGIANVYTNGVTTACFASMGTDILCDRITGVGDPVNGFTDIETITTGSLNANAFTTRGIDFETVYTFPLDKVFKDSGAVLNFRVLVSYLKDLKVTKENRGTLFGVQQLTTFSGTNYAGQVGAGGVDDIASFSESPHWQGNGTVTYMNGPFSSTLQSRYVGSAKLYSDLVGTNDPNYSVTTDNSINTDNHVGSYWLFNISMSYNFDFKNGRNIQLFGVVNNMFDRKPRYAPAITGLGSVSGGGSSVSNPTFYDLVGRRFRIGLRFNY